MGNTIFSKPKHFEKLNRNGGRVKKIMKFLDYTCLILMLIGGINWGLVGIFNFDLVRALFGDMSVLSRIIYSVIGVASLYSISFLGRIRNEV